MAAYDFSAAIAQDVHIQRTMNAKRKRNVIKIAFGLQLLQEPEALLGKGERQVLRTNQRTNPGGSLSFAASQQPFDSSRLVRNRWLFQNAAQRQGRAQNGSHARCNLEGQQGMSSQAEEIVVNTELLYSKHLAPYFRHRLFDRSARQNQNARRAGILGFRQCFQINLAAGS